MTEMRHLQSYLGPLDHLIGAMVHLVTVERLLLQLTRVHELMDSEPHLLSDQGRLVRSLAHTLAAATTRLPPEALQSPGK
jgi:hypothetical protein